MLSLLLSILCSALIFVTFKFIENLKINTFIPIIINYVIATSLGLWLSSTENVFNSNIYTNEFIIISIIAGFMFIAMFMSIALSTQKAGIAVTSIAGKMSVVFPIIFSIFYFNENVTIIKIVAILLALSSIALTVYKKEKTDNKRLLYPLVIFIGIGFLDSLMKYSQAVIINPQNLSVFTALCFGISLCFGIIFSFFKKNLFVFFKDYRIYIAGIILGFLNYGSMYFLIKALTNSSFDSSITFGLNNLGIVGFSVLSGLLLFKEKLNLINWIGIILSIISIILLTKL
ncbi:MAG: hypothetical protein A2046_02790 [Bacteroidetes bacterium GWA2_30_7]|nr:MAG: hypothetical protein A2046_02790 [Bacteroidetes bacterium GWA2_30_7]